MSLSSDACAVRARINEFAEKEIEQLRQRYSGKRCHIKGWPQNTYSLNDIVYRRAEVLVMVSGSYCTHRPDDVEVHDIRGHIDAIRDAIGTADGGAA